MDVMRADTVDADLDRLLRDRWPGKVRRGGAAELATGRRFSGRPDPFHLGRASPTTPTIPTSLRAMRRKETSMIVTEANPMEGRI
jgi:hypothetical protein